MNVMPTFSINKSKEMASGSGTTDRPYSLQAKHSVADPHGRQSVQPRLYVCYLALQIIQDLLYFRIPSKSEGNTNVCFVFSFLPQ